MTILAHPGRALHGSRPLGGAPVAAALLAAIFAVMAACALAFGALPGLAHADESVVLTYERNGGVSDEATEMTVMKLDRNTHAEVNGAHLVIFEKASGAIVDEWVSVPGGHTMVGLLSIDTVYVLRELEAPSGYALAPDTEFVLRSVSNATSTQILSGQNAELMDAYRINLYDTSLVSSSGSATGGSSGGSVASGSAGGASGGNVVQTGDSTSYAGLVAAAVCGSALVSAGAWLARSRAKGNRA